MPGLPVLSGREFVQVFERFGWQTVRQRGSHIILKYPECIAMLSIPDHKEVAKGTVSSVTRAAGLTVETFTAGAGKI
jgi:predicted RNA binding protein YcfA (HicA-like mRNA interferase family)